MYLIQVFGVGTLSVAELLYTGAVTGYILNVLSIFEATEYFL